MIDYHAIAAYLGQTVIVHGTDDNRLLDWSGTPPTQAEFDAALAHVESLTKK